VCDSRRVCQTLTFVQVSPVDGRLYMALGSPCNTPDDPSDANATCGGYIAGRQCDYPAALLPYIGTIISGALPNFTDIRVEVHGLRNSVGMEFVDGELWFTDNGRDNMDPGHDNRPPDELNRRVKNATNTNYGFPFCYGSDTFDPEFNKVNNCLAYVPTVQNLMPHAAALGLRAYQNAKRKSFPAQYHSGLFIAEHGSWDRDPPSGYRVSFVTLDANLTPTAYESFASGWLLWPGGNASTNPAATWARVADVELLDDGSMLITNERRGEIYRVFYSPPVTPADDGPDYLLYIGIGVGVVVLGVIVVGVILYRARKTSKYQVVG